MANPPSVSIVINTLNRADSLDKTLESFRWLNYDGDFEVIVVNGPSTDHSAKVVDKWCEHIRAATCDRPNLSMSRNIGINEARGEIVCFIDDDGVPEPEWLNQISQGRLPIPVQHCKPFGECLVGRQITEGIVGIPRLVPVPIPSGNKCVI